MRCDEAHIDHRDAAGPGRDGLYIRGDVAPVTADFAQDLR
jgi:hypothetical protein